VSQNSQGTTSPTAVERAEHLWENVEQSIKTFTLHTGQSIWQTTTSLPQKFSQHEHPSAESSVSPSNSSSDEATEVPNPPTMERAEQMVGAMGQRLSQWTSGAGLRIQRTTARMREDVEDMLAEAQSIRQRNMRQ
jgi:hypothetical protein